jgi:hypothetical protein
MSSPHQPASCRELICPAGWAWLARKGYAYSQSRADIEDNVQKAFCFLISKQRLDRPVSHAVMLLRRMIGDQRKSVATEFRRAREFFSRLAIESRERHLETHPDEAMFAEGATELPAARSEAGDLPDPPMPSGMLGPRPVTCAIDHELDWLAYPLSRHARAERVAAQDDWMAEPVASIEEADPNETSFYASQEVLESYAELGEQGAGFGA